MLARRQPQVAPALQGAALVRLAVVAAQLVAVLVRPQVAPAPLELAPARQEAPGPGSAASAPEQPASAPEQPVVAPVVAPVSALAAADTQEVLVGARHRAWAAR